MLVRKVYRLVLLPLVRWTSLALLALVGLIGVAPAVALAAPPLPQVAHVLLPPPSRLSPAAPRVNPRAVAQVHVSLTHSPQVGLAPGTLFTYTLTVMNQGPGVAAGTWAGLPLDPNVEVLDFWSGNSSIFVDYLGPDALHIRFHQLDAGDQVTVQIKARVRPTAPQPLTISSRATVTWADAHPQTARVSNQVPVVVGVVAQSDWTDGLQPLQVGASGPVAAGTPLAMQGGFFGGAERISFWINTPQGPVIPVAAMAQTNAQGLSSFTLDTTGFPVGSYSLVAHGWATGIEGLGRFTIR